MANNLARQLWSDCTNGWEFACPVNLSLIHQAHFGLLGNRGIMFLQAYLHQISRFFIEFAAPAPVTNEFESCSLTTSDGRSTNTQSNRESMAKVPGVTPDSLGINGFFC